ncbi:hypothetical protein CLAFUW4_12456 [Fulvia fulva]|uniref:uncharacterized protein n=1 Tax=Passalora fulva TaxID=5499 RepID=UPI002852CC22|nr:uncharacterized protein CLAFUR5_20334 [Fulvia fulva]KAK4617596.1 hypothetical protein CLAFUR4_12461 [Fulvia fulva]KAK4618526.1 hypothetical protein CLAFUR0_12472 [Fulvia fulva]WMI38987.1 hypothetical protein CLAFUR5_20334 [Fulvia fulva]WPV18162.1 hypothetical protein CLAFUW4_12456 [Fulvia fulva]WPV33542.1 hypothetical protein CLAFUW7_12463 [Fulvia fulva]
MSNQTGQPGPSGQSGHRRGIGSEDSVLSMTTQENARLSMSLADQLGQLTFRETDNNFKLPGEQRLQQYMSFRTVISTHSSLARRNTNVSPDQTWRQIGKGSQDVVFEEPGSKFCWKFQLKGGNKQLWNNYVMQTVAREAFERVAKNFPDLVIDVRCPIVGAFVHPSDSGFWSDARAKLEVADAAWGDEGEFKGFSMERSSMGG